MSKLKTLIVYRLRFRVANAWWDFYERWVKGICCAYMLDGEGGYNHWRCGRPRGHRGSHRFINYVWPGGEIGRPYCTAYDPYSADKPGRWGGNGVDHRHTRDRYPSDNRAQRRVRRRMQDSLERRMEERTQTFRPHRRKR